VSSWLVSSLNERFYVRRKAPVTAPLEAKAVQRANRFVAETGEIMQRDPGRVVDGCQKGVAPLATRARAEDERTGSQNNALTRTAKNQIKRP